VKISCFRLISFQRANIHCDIYWVSDSEANLGKKDTSDDYWFMYSRFQIEKLPEDKLTVWQLSLLDSEANLGEKDKVAIVD
jgi:hypothetical protein